jgi:hypothetical protein
VYVGDDYIGTFELPARFPVLKSGKLPVKIWPGIKKNGIATTRVAYDFYSPVEKTLILTPDSSTKAGVLKTTYQSTTKFNWLEDFEDVAITLDTTSRSSAYIERTPSGSPLTFEGTHSAFIQLDSARDFFEAQTRDEYTIPSAPVFLELNFNISNSVTIGVFTYGNTVLYQSPIITLNPTNGTWKKIYIDLTTTLNAYSGMTSFRVYLGTFRDSGLDQPTLMFDNFKIVTR